MLVGKARLDLVPIANICLHCLWASGPKGPNTLHTQIGEALKKKADMEVQGSPCTFSYYCGGAKRCKVAATQTATVVRVKIQDIHLLPGADQADSRAAEKKKGTLFVSSYCCLYVCL